MQLVWSWIRTSEWEYGILAGNPVYRETRKLYEIFLQSIYSDACSAMFSVSALFCFYVCIVSRPEIQMLIRLEKGSHLNDNFIYNPYLHHLWEHNHFSQLKFLISWN